MVKVATTVGSQGWGMGTRGVQAVKVRIQSAASYLISAILAWKDTGHLLFIRVSLYNCSIVQRGIQSLLPAVPFAKPHNLMTLTWNCNVLLEAFSGSHCLVV